jgi:protocatechuate 3,4-dioxygenase beta subunit
MFVGMVAGMDLHDESLPDLSALLHRRNVLKLIGGAGILTVAGCASSSKPRASGSTTTTAASGAASGSNAPIPEETAGPFPGDGSNGPNVLTDSAAVRSDITKSFGSASGTAGGVPTTIEFTLVDTNNANAPLADAAVYVWHCDREGRYSLYSEGVTEENYLRGVQTSDKNGVVTFTSIFPACYSGRWPHVHFEVYKNLADAKNGGTKLATSQIAIPADVCNTVYKTAGYEQSVPNLAGLTLASDMVFADDGGVRELATVSGNSKDGYKIALTVPV